MKAKTLIIAALMIMASVGVQAQDFQHIPSCAGSVERAENRFTGSVTLHTSLNLTLGNHFAVVFRALKTEGVSSHIYALSFIASGDQFDYLDCHSVSMLVDGKRVNIPFDYTPRVGRDGFVTETLQATLTKEQFNKLAYAGKVEYSVCGSEHIVPESVLCTGREISRLSLATQ